MRKMAAIMGRQNRARDGCLDSPDKTELIQAMEANIREREQRNRESAKNASSCLSAAYLYFGELTPRYNFFPTSRFIHRLLAILRSGCHTIVSSEDN
jgi:hypothetical protein